MMHLYSLLLFGFLFCVLKVQGDTDDKTEMNSLAGKIQCGKSHMAQVHFQTMFQEGTEL